MKDYYGSFHLMNDTWYMKSALQVKDINQLAKDPKRS